MFYDKFDLLRNLNGPMRAWVERQLGADRAAPMFEDKNTAEAYLQHSEPECRIAAIAVLAHHWAADDTLGAICERLLLADPDARVRSFAATYVGACHAGTDALRAGKRLAEVVWRNSEPHEVRLAAYRALLAIGLPRGAALPRDLRDDFRFPEDVDWRFVDSFLSG